ncbi:MAG: hypothetical protein F4057_11065, partial [Acidobacteria bacterium]|nr:hypothetical protein [Acidobacteriota bacterium]
MLYRSQSLSVRAAFALAVALVAGASSASAAVQAREPQGGEEQAEEPRRRGGVLGPRRTGEAAPEPPPPPAAPAAVPAEGEPRIGVATGAGVLTGRPTVRPPRVLTAPVIDGRLDDDVWRDAALLTEFYQRQPLDGAPPPEAPEVYI